MSGKYPPCLNPRCKSYGHSHPNCRCWPTGKLPLAEGGEVGHFCSEARGHSPECEFHFKGQDPEHAVPCVVAKLGLLGLLNKGKNSIFDDVGGRGIGSNFENFASHIKHGDKKIDDHIEALFGGKPAFQENPKESKEKLKELLSTDFLNKHMTESEEEPSENRFARGGKVKEEPENTVAQLFPAHNAMLNIARGRAYHYLNSLRPQEHVPRLAFDDEVKSPVIEKIYDGAINIANHPLSVLEHIRKGSIAPEHVAHFSSMYPELKSHVDKRITERITKAQVDKEKPEYKIRQGLSLFMGTPLDSTFTPLNIQAAQSVFAAQAVQQQSASAPQQKKNKRGTSSLTKASDQYETANQAREQRLSQPR